MKLPVLRTTFGHSSCLERIPQNESRQFRHVLLHMLYPDSYERVFTNKHRIGIVEHYQPTPDIYNQSAIFIDKKLNAIRTELIKQKGTDKIDFWQVELQKEWNKDDTMNEEGDMNLPADSPTQQTGKDSTSIKRPINRIFFGPPGTGKTYRLNKLKKKYIQKFTSQDWLREKLRLRAWWEIAFLVLRTCEKNAATAQFISSHELMKIYASTKDSKQPYNTIYDELQSHSISQSSDTYGNRGTKVFKQLDDNKKWKLLENHHEICPDLIEFEDELKKGIPEEKTIERFKFVTFHQAYSYEDFVEGIRPIVDKSTGTFTYKVRPGVFREICDSASQDQDQRYALFIDEINRGNIAKIFGELITLIEPDKRLGEDNEIKVRLPNSGKNFGVPSNLDIYGTMNSADRSIALLDTALRRRFQFEPIMPDPKWIKGLDGDGKIPAGDGGGEIDLLKLFNVMNERIEYLRDRNFKIGHAYFMDIKDFDTFRDKFFDQIIPLLQEYFFDDWFKIQIVLGDIGAEGKKAKPQIISHKNKSRKKIMGFDDDLYPENFRIYSVIGKNEITPAAIQKIYSSSN